MKVLYLLCGLAFAGKSTIAGRIAALTGASVISLDELNLRRGLHGGEGIPDSEWARTHLIAVEELREMCRRGDPVVIDDTNCFRWLRDAYRKEAAAFGYRSVVLLLDVSLEEALRRASANDQTMDRARVTREVMQELAGKFEYPGHDEEVLTITTTNSGASSLAGSLESRGLLGS